MSVHVYISSDSHRAAGAQVKPSGSGTFDKVTPEPMVKLDAIPYG